MIEQGGWQGSEQRKNGKSLKMVLNELERSHKVHFSYANEIVDEKFISPEQLKKLDKDVEKTLKYILSPLGLKYREVEENFYFILQESIQEGQGVKWPETGMGPGESELLSLTKINGLRNTAVLTSAGILDKTVAGKVTDQNSGESLPGVNVLVKGTTTGTVTDADGNYMLTVSDEAEVLVFSFIGYITKEVTIGNQTVINVQIALDNKALSEVVVIGYGTQQRREVTGAVSSVDAEDITQVAVTGLDQAMQGRMAGVQVTQNSGEPGGSVSVRIRGIGSLSAGSEPLYVVDGIPLAGGLNAINPNDIERIDVLKDAASAAIYGSRATNGVVLVTTKRGKAGKVTVNLDAYAGVQRAAKKLDLLNGPEFARLANENLSNGGQPINPEWNNPEAQPTYDWQDEIFQTSPMQSYNVSLSGGGEKSRTFFSAGYFQQGGIVVGSNYERYTGRLNTDYDITDKIKVGATLNLSYSKKKSVSTEDSFGGALLNSAQMQPVNPIFTDQEGVINDHLFGWEGYAFTPQTANITNYPSGLNNPVHTIKHYLKSPADNMQMLTALFGEYEIIKGLKLRSTLNLTLDNQWSFSSSRKSPDEISFIGQYRSQSGYSEYWSKGNQWNWINYLSYDNRIGEHNFSVFAGIDALKANSHFISGSTTGAPDEQQSINASNIEGRTVTGFPSDNSLVSYIGRLTYNYAERYLLTVNFRRDGSSKFGPNNKYGNFPSASVGWVISEENFLKPVNFLDELKVRASYGVVGNQNIGNFRYLNIFSSDGGMYAYTLGSGQQPVPALYVNNVGDPDIRWEKSIQTDFGIDASFLSGKFTLTADYYIKKLEDLLGYIPIPTYTGVHGGTVFRNGFSMENRGVELALGYHHRIGEVNLSTNVNFSTLDNKITELYGSEKSYIAQGVGNGEAQTRSQVGERVANFWGYVTDGIFQNQEEISTGGMSGVFPGDRRYKDLNGDGIVNADDKTVLGNGTPRYTYGINLKADYKGVDFSVFLTGQADVQIANTSRFYLYHMRYHNSTGIVNGSKDLLDSWRGEGTSNDMPRNAYDVPASNKLFSTYYIEDGSFLRIRNLQLGYTIPDALTRATGFGRARIYVTAQNLYTFTKYSGYDPEVGSIGNNPLAIGADIGGYPIPRIFMGGINIQF